MKLKSLELFGFKSFVDKTVISFEEGINGVVGPNGAGKSNLVDAIRWTMGEQSAKHLRGSEMQDVIFSGTSKRPPIGMAQVVMTFDSSDGRAPAGYADYAEIQVERRLYRSGESEYYINKVPCRLRDIIDLFLGTGVGTKAYSIIEQGQIGRIVSSKAEERRFIIEEAAGISKFKNRKEAALRRIQSTESNLGRLGDVVSEIKRQLNSLDRQAKKAERYRKLYNELKEKDLKVSAVRFEQNRVETEKMEAGQNKLNQDEAALAAELAEVEAEIEKERLESAALEGELSTVQEKYYMRQNAVKLHEASLEYQQTKIKDLGKQSETYAKEVEEMREKLVRAAEEIEKLNRMKVTLDLQLAGAREKIETAEKEYDTSVQFCEEWKAKTEGANREMLQVVGEVAETQSRLEYLERRDVETDGRVAKGQAEIDAIDKMIEGLHREIKKSERNVEDLKQLSFQISGETDGAKGELNAKRAALEENGKKLEELKGNLAHKASRLQSLETLYQDKEGYHEGVRAVLQASEVNLKGICGPVGEIIDTDAEYELAVNAVLGEKLQYVVVRSQSEGVEAVEYLKQQAKGRSTFVPLGIEGGVSETTEVKGEGVQGRLMEKIRFNDDYRHIARYLFGDCLLMEDLQKALNVWKEGARGKTLVTLQGEVIDRDGVISGGHQTEESILGHKRRMEVMQEEIGRAKACVTEAENELREIKIKIRSLEERVETLGRDSHGEEIRRVQKERDVLRLREELGRYHKDRDRLSMEIARCLDEKGEGEKEKESVILALDEKVARRQVLEKELAESQSKLNQTTVTKDRLSQELSKVRGEASQTADRVENSERELARWVETKLELQEGVAKRIDGMNLGQTESKSLAESQLTERVQLEEALKEMEILGAKQKELRERYDGFSRCIQKREIKVREVRHRHEEVMKRSHENDLRLAEVRNQSTVLADQVVERYKEDIRRYCLKEPSAQDFNLDAAVEEIAILREKLEKMGSVHVGAIEEYDELKARYDFLTAQQEDLVQSLESLKKAIQKINRVSRERFLKTFEMVNEKFKDVFPRLFKGGKAKLVLLDEQNPLESGVEIVAQPPGKKLQSITLLSGGEKALTAVALIFSIFLIKPSPFCLLDEVDAPLDDANIDRFNEMVKEMTTQSQFIVITHNKRTMEQTDCLYGITMEEAGVSKVVSVRLNQERLKPLPNVA